MKRPWAVRAPISLLMDRDLAASAKVIWLVLRLHDTASPAVLQAQSGLSRPTVLCGLARLTAASWYTGVAVDRAPSEEHVSLPGDMLAERRIGARGKVLYGILQVVPGYSNESGEFTYAYLAQLLGVSAKSIKQIVGELVQTGWLYCTQTNKFAPVHFTLKNPVLLRSENEVAKARRRLNKAKYFGEALLREFLTVRVASDNWEDDATPDFLVSPLTDEPLQLDRFYRPNVAFEFNGPQHYGPTERFSDYEQVVKQQVRDMIKRGICVTKGIHLLVLHAEDLTLETITRKISGLLPLRDLTGHERLIAFLESESRAYRAKAQKHRPVTTG